VSSVYFDTSAFLKILILEPGSPTAVRAWRVADSVTCSRLLHVEARAALAMARRQGRLSAAQHAQAKGALNAYWQDLYVLEVTEPVVEDVGDLAEGVALRGYDAVHLASALRSGVDVLITADIEMVQAARNRGLKVIDSRF
jgi:predicted nucleic acid-binding protein